MKPIIAAVCAALLLGSSAAAQEAGTQKIDEINARYEAEYKKIETEASKLDDFDPSKVGAAVGVDIKVTKKRVDISFDTPRVSMKRRDMVMHLPQMAMRTKEMSFDIPEFEWGTTDIGPISLDLPKIYSKRVSFSMDIPEFTWETTTIKMDVPEFFMERQEIKFDVPEVEVINVRKEVKEIEAKSKELEQRSATLVASQRGELVAATGEMFDGIEKQVIVERDKAVLDLNAAIEQLKDAIKTVEYYSMDPRKVRNEDGSQTDLIAQLDELIAQRDDLIKKIDDNLTDLRLRREEAIAGIGEAA